MSNIVFEPRTSKPTYERKVDICISVHNLYYDVQNMAYVEGDIAPTDNEHDRHQIFDICEEGNIDRVNRVASLAVRECGEFLFPYVKQIVEDDVSADDHDEHAYCYDFELLVPADFPQLSVDVLKEQIHEYVVCRILSDWLSITNLKNPGSAEVWAAKMQNAKDAIVRTLRTRSRRVRRTLTPF